MTASATISLPDGLTAERPPRVRSHPAYSYSAGPETIRLCAEAGLILDDWQALIVTDQVGMRDDGKFAAVECGDAIPRQNGKGGIIEARKLAGLFLFEERVVFYTAHQFKTAQEHFRRMKEYIDGSDELRRQVMKVSDAHGKEGIELYGASRRHRLTRTRRLMYHARSKGSGRGFTGDGVLFLDEAQYLNAKQLAALIPTLSAVSLHGNPQLIYHGTPPDPSETEDGGQYWISVRKRGLLGQGRICWHEYSPPTDYPRSATKPDGFDRTDPALHRMTNPALGRRISEEFVQTVELEAMVAAGTPEVFDRERLGAWPPDPGEGWRVIPEPAWREANDQHSKLLDPVCFAIATDLHRNWTTISAAGRREDGLWHVEVIDRRPSVAWAYPRIAELLGKWRNCGVVIVASGPGGALIPDIEARTVDDKAGGTQIEVVKASVQDYAKGCGMFQTGLTGQAAEGEPDPKRFRWRAATEFRTALETSVRAAVKHPTGDVWTFERDLEPPVDTSPLESAVMALWGFASFGQTAPNAPVTVSAELRNEAANFFRPQGRLKL